MPKCYDIEDELKATMNIPVFHDDQHGTAIAALAAVLAALRLIKKGIGGAKEDCGYVWRRRGRHGYSRTVAGAMRQALLCHLLGSVTYC